jgi:hypothetical protein
MKDIQNFTLRPIILKHCMGKELLLDLIDGWKIAFILMGIFIKLLGI